jgi:hypothetical protein
VRQLFAREKTQLHDEVTRIEQQKIQEIDTQTLETNNHLKDLYTSIQKKGSKSVV